MNQNSEKRKREMKTNKINTKNKLNVRKREGEKNKQVSFFEILLSSRIRHFAR